MVKSSSHISILRRVRRPRLISMTQGRLSALCALLLVSMCATPECLCLAPSIMQMLSDEYIFEGSSTLPLRRGFGDHLADFSHLRRGLLLEGTCLLGIDRLLT